MILFWMLCAVSAAGAAMLVLAGARRGWTPGVDAEAEAGRAELAELDRQKAEGRLSQADWTVARAEAGRRLIAAGPAPVPGPEAGAGRGRRDRLWVLGGCGAAVALTLGLYLATGTPGAPDQPFERRVDDWSKRPQTLDAAQMAAVVGRLARQDPGDHEVMTMLGAARFQAGDPIGAAQAFRRALTLRPDDATSWARLGESLVRANDGVVGADAEQAFAEAFRRDPGQLGARFFLGEAALARGDVATAAGYWRPLQAALTPEDPRRDDLERRLAAAGA